MNMTKHARQRLSQRGIPQDTAQLIYLMGHSAPAPGGVECLSISRKDGLRLIQDCHHLIDQTERAMKGTQLVLGNGKVITAKHPRKHSNGFKQRGFTPKHLIEEDRQTRKED